MLLARDPEILEARTKTDKDIFYNPAAGLPRAERELAAAAVSRDNGCIFCASVHARFASTYLEAARGHAASPGQRRHDRHRRALECDHRRVGRVEPNAVRVRSASDVERLEASGLDDLAISDVVHSAAFFKWANRLMLSLGEPTPPAKGLRVVVPLIREARDAEAFLPSKGLRRDRAAEVGVANPRIPAQVLGDALQHDASVLQHVGLMRDLQRQIGVLLHHENGNPLRVDLRDQFEHPVDVERRKSHGGFVHADEARAAHQRARHGHHLLLAARERARPLIDPLRDAREDLQQLREIVRGSFFDRAGRRPSAGFRARSSPEKEPSRFGNGTDPGAYDLMRGLTVDPRAVET